MNLHPKTTGAGVAGAVVTAVVAILGAFGVDVPPDAAAAATALLAVVVAYLVPSSQNPPPVA